MIRGWMPSKVIETGSLAAMLALVFARAEQSVWAGNPPKNSAAETEDCVLLKQLDCNAGDVSLFLGAKNVRVDAMNGRCHIVAGAPKWEVVIYNNDGKMYSMPLSEWRVKGLGIASKSRRDEFVNGKVKLIPVTYMGKKCISVTRSAVAIHGPNIDLAYQVRTTRAESPDPAGDVTYTASNDFQFTKPVNDFVEGFYLTSPVARVLLRTEVNTRTKRHVFNFKTLSIGHEKLPLSQFVVPKGLTRAYSTAAVATGSDLEDILLESSGGTANK